ncbi:MAG: endonuclease III [Peptococcaceae bacterium]|jgi:endonuclease-3|nr:endonuclease III [Peptococcaceae bacterium]MDH7526203.1 endonuclease III [Peptococcaceae bacterium]
MQERKQRVLEILEKEYRGAATALEFKNPFELLVAAVLSAQTTDRQVNRLTKSLFARYPTPGDMAGLSEEELAREIRGCGLYRGKARNILAAVRILLEKYGGEVPADREALMRLPGVGRKTANVVLAGAFGIPALGVDTHVFRVARRLGLAGGATPLQVERELTSFIPREKWAAAHHWLIWHGRKICRARSPLCARCPLMECCAARSGERRSTHQQAVDMEE